MKVRDELRPFYHPTEKSSPDQQPSAAEQLALNALSAIGNKPTSLPAKSQPLPSPQMINQMILQPPPSFATSNRFQVLAGSDNDQSSIIAAHLRKSELQTTADKISPTVIPDLPPAQLESLPLPPTPMDVVLNSGPTPDTATADWTDPVTYSTDLINPDIDSQDSLNVTSRRPRKQPKPTRLNKVAQTTWRTTLLLVAS